MFIVFRSMNRPSMDVYIILLTKISFSKIHEKNGVVNFNHRIKT